MPYASLVASPVYVRVQDPGSCTDRSIYRPRADDPCILFAYAYPPLVGGVRPKSDEVAIPRWGVRAACIYSGHGYPNQNAPGTPTATDLPVVDFGEQGSTYADPNYVVPPQVGVSPDGSRYCWGQPDGSIYCASIQLGLVGAEKQCGPSQVTLFSLPSTGFVWPTAPVFEE